MVKSFNLFMINLKTNMRYKLNFFSLSLVILIPIIPLLTMFINGNIALFGFDSIFEYSLYLMLAATFWSFVEVLWSFTFSMRQEIKEGIINETLMMPVSTYELLFGWTLDGIISTVFQAIPILLISIIYLLSANGIGDLLLFVGVFIITSIAGYAFAVILIGLMLVYKETDQLVSFLGNIAPFICGMIIPLSYVPKVFRFIGLLFPFSWGLDIIRSVVFSVSGIFPITYEVMILILLTIFYLILSGFIFKHLYFKSRKNGGIVGY